MFYPETFEPATLELIILAGNAQHLQLFQTKLKKKVENQGKDFLFISNFKFIF